MFVDFVALPIGLVLSGTRAMIATYSMLAAWAELNDDDSPESVSVTYGQLAEALDVTVATTGTAIRALVRVGWILRLSDQGDPEPRYALPFFAPAAPELVVPHEAVVEHERQVRATIAADEASA
jgi:hypothetical protein